MSKFKNTKKDKAFKEFESLASLDSESDTITQRCKFNFHYFEKQKAGQNFDEWNHDELIKLMHKLKYYSESPLHYWKNQRTGAGGLKVLEIYESFPINSDFTEPKHIPAEVHWARFRLEQKVRLIGFVIPESFYDRKHDKTDKRFDTNTFYVVFLDKNHRFYKIENK
jgi:hypothetical protein